MRKQRGNEGMCVFSAQWTDPRLCCIREGRSELAGSADLQRTKTIWAKTWRSDFSHPICSRKNTNVCGGLRVSHYVNFNSNFFPLDFLNGTIWPATKQEDWQSTAWGPDTAHRVTDRPSQWPWSQNKKTNMKHFNIIIPTYLFLWVLTRNGWHELELLFEWAFRILLL